MSQVHEAVQTNQQTETFQVPTTFLCFEELQSQDGIILIFAKKLSFRNLKSFAIHPSEFVGTRW